jgi:nitroimidazol reductase NimA-like FMN-containing flavoprotein (pyridoxamine 5'-phosphate oxidase superfamily)
MADEKQLDVTPRTKLKRFHERGVYSRRAINAILDEGLICHLGFAVDGQPFVIPTAYARDGDHIYLHGSAASRTLRALAGGIRVCVTVTLVDGIVLARSAFNHSFNYRSVVILGVAIPVSDPDEKTRALTCFTNKLIPGRWDEIRWPNKKELRATSVLTLPISEASAKIRTGPPGDPPEDLDVPCWAGVIPLALRDAPGEPSPNLSPEVKAPTYVSNFLVSRGNRASRNGGSPG